MATQESNHEEATCENATVISPERDEREKMLAARPKRTNEIRPGDMVKFDRGLYMHWGVCIGDNQMVHVAPRNGTKELNSLNSFSSGSQAVVRVELIDKWAKEGEYGSDNYLDGKHAARSAEDICSFAMDQVDSVYWSYDPISSNCEKFAIWCRYRIDNSGRQATLAKAAIFSSLFFLAGGLSAAVVAGGSAALAYSWYQKNKDKKRSSRRCIVSSEDQELTTSSSSRCHPRTQKATIISEQGDQECDDVIELVDVPDKLFKPD